MRLAIQTDTRQVKPLLWDSTTAWESDHLANVSFARRDKFPVEVRFVTSAPAGSEGAFLTRYGWLAFTGLPEGASGRLYLKPATGFAGTPLAAATYWSKLAGAVPTYSFYLNLDTVQMAGAFETEPASVALVLEIEWAYLLAGTETKQTISPPVAVKVFNDYIRDADGVPIPALDARIKATQAQAEAGTDNERWMTPPRVWDAIRKWASTAFTWANLGGKPVAFPPEPHTHPASQITGLAIGDAAWDSITGKPSAFPPAAHQHALADVAGLQTALDGKQPAGSYATAAQGAKADSALQPPALAPYRTASAQDTIDSGKAPASHTHTAAQITDFAAAVAAVVPVQAPLSVVANSGITSTGNTLATAYNTAIGDTVVSVPVGGAPAAPASAWKAKTLVQALDDILFPTIPASIGAAKAASLAVSGAAGTLEAGTSVARTLTASFSRGTILDGTGATNANALVGAATSYTFTGTGISSTTQAGATLSFTAAVASGSNGWAVSVAHGAGTGTYTDNKGNAGSNLDGSRGAGTVAASSVAITGVYPYYYLKSASPISASGMAAAIQNGTATKVVASSSGTLSIPYAPASEYLAVAYPASSATKTKYYVTALDNGAIEVVFAPMATQSIATTLWSQSYKIHTSTAALTNSNSTIQLQN